MVKLFRKNSNLCDHNPPTLQTDGQTDRRHAIAIPRFALVHRAVKTSTICRYIAADTRRTDVCISPPSNFGLLLLQNSNLKVRSVALTVLGLFNVPNSLIDRFAAHTQTHNAMKTTSPPFTSFTRWRRR